jgi:hypothetical protein
LFWRHAVDSFGPWPHELDAAARHDEGPESVGPKVCEQFLHRLVDQFGIGPLELLITRGREPIGDDLLELRRGHAGMRHGNDFDQSVFAGSRQLLQVVIQHRRKRLLGLPFGMHRRKSLHPVERKGQLDIHRLLDPERTVIIEGRDALLDRHEEAPALRCVPCDEIEDRSLGGAVVPGRQRIALRLCHG